METDFIGGFPEVSPLCKGCGKPLLIENACVTDGCPCNSPLGINSMNETRWRLLMQLQQQQSHEVAELRKMLEYIMNQVEMDLRSAHAEIVKLQGGDPTEYEWPEWSPQANTLRWFKTIRGKYGIEDRQ